MIGQPCSMENEVPDPCSPKLWPHCWQPQIRVIQLNSPGVSETGGIWHSTSYIPFICPFSSQLFGFPVYLFIIFHFSFFLFLLFLFSSLHSHTCTASDRSILSPILASGQRQHQKWTLRQRCWSFLRRSGPGSKRLQSIFSSPSS